jgi:hypothetical protein
MRLITVNVVDTGATIALPAAPSVAPQGTTGATAYGYAVVARLSDGRVTGIGATGSTATGNATLTVSHFNRVTIVAYTGALSYDLYRVTGGVTQGFIGNTTSLTFDDTGLEAFGFAPTAGVIPLKLNPSSILSIAIKSDGAHPQIVAEITMTNGDTHDVDSTPDDVESLSIETTRTDGEAVGSTSGGGVLVGGGSTGAGSGGHGGSNQ